MPVSSRPLDQDHKPTQRINVLTPAEWVTWLDQMAATKHQKRAGVLRDIIRRAIDAPDQPLTIPPIPRPCYYVGLDVRTDWLVEIDRRAAGMGWKRPTYIRALIWAASQES